MQQLNFVRFSPFVAAHAERIILIGRSKNLIKHDIV